jgi:hypothetical protein
MPRRVAGRNGHWQKNFSGAPIVGEQQAHTHSEHASLARAWARLPARGEMALTPPGVCDVLAGMRCNICGGDRLTASEYRTGSVRAPAMECVACHAIVLDESLATSEQERDSVRLAVAARAASCATEPRQGQWLEEAHSESDGIGTS